MKQKEMERLTAHFDSFFAQSDATVLHPIVDNGLHVDVLLYEPTEKYPFWKLVTMGASDYCMPEIARTLGRRNEYIMFVDGAVDLTDPLVMQWYHGKLMTVATFAYGNQAHVTCGHSFEWKNEDPEDEMIAAFLEFPQIVPDAGIVRCRVSLLKTVVCLQLVLLNSSELAQLMQIGPRAFSEYLYPERGGRCHFLSERHRSDKF